MIQQLLTVIKRLSASLREAMAEMDTDNYHEAGSAETPEWVDEAYLALNEADTVAREPAADNDLAARVRDVVLEFRDKQKSVLTDQRLKYVVKVAYSSAYQKSADMLTAALEMPVDARKPK